MKNTLDWLVSSSEFVDLPIMLINTSPRAHHALDALKEILTTMSGVIVSSAFVAIPLLGTKLETELSIRCDNKLDESVYIADNQEHHVMLTKGLNAFYEYSVNNEKQVN